jgi:probable addiction module antidote protein
MTEMAHTKTKPFDAVDYLKTEDDMIGYLEAAFEEDDPRVVAAALGDIARAKGMSQVAREAGLGRESLYRSLSAEGNPELGTIMKVMRSLGLSLHARRCA